MNMGMERWGFLFSVMNSPIVYFLKTTCAVCQNINLVMLCMHVCDVNYAACYWKDSSDGMFKLLESMHVHVCVYTQPSHVYKSVLYLLYNNCRAT